MRGFSLRNDALRVAALGLLLQDGADGPNDRRTEVCGPGDPGPLERWLEPIAYESVEHVLRLPDIDNAGAPTLHRPLDVQDLAGDGVLARPSSRRTAALCSWFMPGISMR
jgi:hypothetical protein